MESIFFIHGMFQNPRSWDNWSDFFTAKDYHCSAPAWPFHDGEPWELRQNPPQGLGELRFSTVIDRFRKIAAGQIEKPILIGHSMGGVIVQVLASEGLAKMGVVISSVAPDAMIAFDWGFFWNSVCIANSLKADDPYLMDVEGFHESFCNTMSMEKTRDAYDKYVTHGSRSVFRDRLGNNAMPHVPLLFIAGGEDQIIPQGLVAKNAKAYADQGSQTDFLTFPGRDHFICNEPGWEEVARSVQNWLRANYSPAVFT